MLAQQNLRKNQADRRSSQNKNSKGSGNLLECLRNSKEASVKEGRESREEEQKEIKS